MASVYILFSNCLNKHYIGSCLDLQIRLEQHRNQTFHDAFTAKAKDWILVLEINNLEYLQARNIEKHLKKMKSSTYVNNLLKYPEMIEKLKSTYNEQIAFR